MSNMEEKLWEYIDGTCNEHDKATIAALIENDEKWRTAFNNLLQIEDDISAITLEEPPMAFSYNVMEAIRNEQAAKPLKTKVNSFFITCIAAVLLLCLGALSYLILSNDMQIVGNASLDINIQSSVLDILTNSVAMKAFVYFDIMLLLFFADRWIRGRNKSEAAKSV